VSVGDGTTTTESTTTTADNALEKKKKKKKVEYYQGKIVQVNLDGTYDIAFRADVSEDHGLARKWIPDADSEWDVSQNEDDWTLVSKRGVPQNALVFIPERENGSILTLLLTQWVDKLLHTAVKVQKTVEKGKEKVRRMTGKMSHREVKPDGDDSTATTIQRGSTIVIEDESGEDDPEKKNRFFDTKVVPVKEPEDVDI
jgi:hypothetical protein